MNIIQFFEITKRLEITSKGNASFGSDEEPNWSDLMQTGVYCRKYALYDDAIWCYNQAIELTDSLNIPFEGKDKMKSGALSAKAMCLSTMGNNQEALKICELAINLMPDNYEAYCNKGIAHYNIREIAESLNSHEKAISLNPDCANSWNAIGMILVDNLKDYNKALKYLDKAIELSNGEDAHAWINKGNALSYLGKIDEAFICWDTAYEIEPNRNVHAMLNKAVWLLNGKKNKVASLDLLKKVKTEINPSNPYYNQAINLYNRILNDN